jgi:hypothetical protein
MGKRTTGETTMPIVKEGKIQYLNFGTIRSVFQDVKRYLETGHVPGWAREMERNGIPHDQVMDEVILQISDAAVGMHSSLLARRVAMLDEKPNTENPRCPYEPAYRER